MEITFKLFRGVFVTEKGPSKGPFGASGGRKIAPKSFLEPPLTPLANYGDVCGGLRLSCSTRVDASIVEYEFLGAHKYKYTASTAIQLTGLGMCRFYQIPFSGEIYWSAHKDKCRYVYILLALPFSSLGWVCAGFTRVSIE